MAAGRTHAGRHEILVQGEAAPGHPVTPATAFEIGSITKVFTTLLLADMVLRHELELDQPVATLLPSGVSIPRRDGQPITLRHLATHRSGLPRIPDLDGDAADPYATFTPDRLYDVLARHTLTQTPGTTTQYSNLGVGLLGHALGHWSGLGYAGLLADRILRPLELTATRLGPAPALAQGHDPDGDPTPPWRFDALAGAGALISTTRDLLRLLDAMMDPASFLCAATELMMRPAADGGIGFATSAPTPPIDLWHGGGTGGFRSFAGCVRSARHGAVVLANGAGAEVVDLGLHMLDRRWAPAWHRTPLPLEPAWIPSLLGRYRMTPAMEIEIAHPGSHMTARLSGQDPARIHPASPWSFFYRVVNAQLTFIPGPDGRAASLVLHQNGADTAATRIA